MKMYSWSTPEHNKITPSYGIDHHYLERAAGMVWYRMMGGRWDDDVTMQTRWPPMRRLHMESLQNRWCASIPALYSSIGKNSRSSLTGSFLLVVLGLTCS